MDLHAKQRSHARERKINREGHFIERDLRLYSRKLEIDVGKGERWIVPVDAFIKSTASRFHKMS